MVKKVVYYFNIIRNRIVEYIWNKASVKSTINGVCLVFHHINLNHVNTPDSCQCTPEAFAKIIEGLEERGYDIVSLDEFQLIIKQKLNKKFVIITFDDVPVDMYENAYPYLKRKKVPFTVFVTNSFIDKKGYLNKSQLNELLNEPLCTIGAHTITHPHLRFTSDKRKEIIDGGDELESIIAQKVKYFAYPYGSLYSTDHRSIKLAQSRYLFSFSTINADLNDFTINKSGFLPRKAINDINQLTD